MDGIKMLAEKYAPKESAKSREKEIQSEWNTLALELTIEHMTGKQAVELAEEKRKN